MASKFLNSFVNIDEYNAYKESADYERPNVAYIIDEDRVIVDNGQPTTPDSPVDPPVDPNPPTPGDFDEGWLTGQFLDPENVIIRQSPVRDYAFSGTNAQRVTLYGDTGQYLFENCSVQEVLFGDEWRPTSVRNLFRNARIDHLPPVPSVVSGDIDMGDMFHSCRNLKEVEFWATEPFRFLTGFYNSTIKKLILHCPPPTNGCDIPDSMVWIFVPDEYVDDWKTRYDYIEELGVKILPLSTKDNYDANAVSEFIEYNGRLAVTDPFGKILRKIDREGGEDTWSPGEGSESRINFYNWNPNGWYDMVLEEDGRYLTIHRNEPSESIHYVDWTVPDRQNWYGEDLLDSEGRPIFDAWNVKITFYLDERVEAESPMYSSESLTTPIIAPENGPASFEIYWDEENGGLLWRDTPTGDFEAKVRALNNGEFPNPFISTEDITVTCQFYKYGDIIQSLDGNHITFTHEEGENGEYVNQVGFVNLEGTTDLDGQPLLNEDGSPHFDGIKFNVFFDKQNGRGVEYHSGLIPF